MSSDRVQFVGHVTEQGGLRVEEHDKHRWARHLRAMAGKRVTLSLEPWKERRNAAQLRRWFGCIVPVVQDILSQGRTVPLSKEQVHRVLCGAFIGHEPGGVLGQEIPIESKTLSPAQFAEVMDKVEAHFRSECGAVFPTLDGEVDVA